MGKRRTWTSKQKAKIVLEGLNGRAIADLCNEYRIHQTQYYRWRDQFLENVGEVFETKQQSSREERLKKENQRLKQMVGELTMELKKSDW
jgi:transposase-like protein